MKKNVFKFVILAIIVFFGFGLNSTIQAKEKNSGKSKLLVYYFHSTHRCPTCKSIEDNTKATLDKYFHNELKNGIIEFKAINVDEKANEKLAKKYDAFGSALFITSFKNGKEQTEDLTNFAFKYSRNKTDYFIDELKKKIEGKLN